MIYQLLLNNNLLCVCGSRRLTAGTMTPFYNRATCPQLPYKPTCSPVSVADAWQELQVFDCQFVKHSQERKHCWLTQLYKRGWNRLLYLSLENAVLCFQGYVQTTNMAAVAQEVELVIHSLEGRRFNPRLHQSARRSVLWWDIGPQVAPSGFNTGMWLYVWLCGPLYIL